MTAKESHEDFPCTPDQASVEFCGCNPPQLGMPSPDSEQFLSHTLCWPCMVLLCLFQDGQHRVLLPGSLEISTNWKHQCHGPPPCTRSADLQADIAMHAVNMPGGLHWLPLPIPQISRTVFRMVSCVRRCRKRLVNFTTDVDRGSTNFNVTPLVWRNRASGPETMVQQEELC